jgi:hypothetical protein
MLLLTWLRPSLRCFLALFPSCCSAGRASSSREGSEIGSASSRVPSLRSSSCRKGLAATGAMQRACANLGDTPRAALAYLGGRSNVRKSEDREHVDGHRSRFTAFFGPHAPLFGPVDFFAYYSSYSVSKSFICDDHERCRVFSLRVQLSSVCGKQLCGSSSWLIRCTSPRFPSWAEASEQMYDEATINAKAAPEGGERRGRERERGRRGKRGRMDEGK